MLLAAKRCDRKLEYAVPVDIRVPNPMGKFIFVSELTSGRTDVDYCNEAFREVFNKPKLWQLLDGIQHETSLTTEDVAEMVTAASLLWRRATRKFAKNSMRWWTAYPREGKSPTSP